MKVMQVLPALESGGVERGTLEVGRFLAARGHRSVVVSAGGRQVAQLEREGSRHIALALGKKRLATLLRVPELARVLREEKPDILHLRSRLPAWMAYLALKLLKPAERPRVVTSVHGLHSTGFYSSAMVRGERVIAVSEAVGAWIRTNYPWVPPARVTVIPRGVEPKDYFPGYRPAAAWRAKWEADFPQLRGKVVLTLPGRISRLKGQLDLVKLMAPLVAEGLPVHALVVGDVQATKRAFGEEVRRAVADAGLESAITFTGHRQDLRDILSVSDFVLSLSVDPEAFGRTAVEALALGRPLAGYDHGGVSEILGTLFPAGRVPLGDVAGMAQKLSGWIRRPETRPAPAADNPYTLERMLSSTLGVYEELLASPRN